MYDAGSRSPSTLGTYPSFTWSGCTYQVELLSSFSCQIGQIHSSQGQYIHCKLQLVMLTDPVLPCQAVHVASAIWGVCLDGQAVSLKLHMVMQYTSRQGCILKHGSPADTHFKYSSFQHYFTTKPGEPVVKRVDAPLGSVPGSSPDLHHVVVSHIFFLKLSDFFLNMHMCRFKSVFSMPFILSCTKDPRT